MKVIHYSAKTMRYHTKSGVMVTANRALINRDLKMSLYVNQSNNGIEYAVVKQSAIVSIGNTELMADAINEFTKAM